MAINEAAGVASNYERQSNALVQTSNNTPCTIPKDSFIFILATAVVCVEDTFLLSLAITGEEMVKEVDD